MNLTASAGTPLMDDDFFSIVQVFPFCLVSQRGLFSCLLSPDFGMTIPYNINKLCPFIPGSRRVRDMKMNFALVACLAFIFLAGCQSVAPLPVPTPTETPISTTILAPSPTTIPMEPVNVMAFCTLIGKDSKTYVPRDTPINIIWGWNAKTEAQINDFLQNNITEITLDGKVIEGTISGGIQKNPTSGLPEVVWFSDVGVLDPGQHTVTYDVKWKKMIEDGMSTYGPGGKNETEHDECQIIVQ
jgi:hypothetical protein